MASMAYVPGRLRGLRVAAGQTQRSIGSWSDVPASLIGRWERGEVPIPEEHQARLAELFGVNVPWLMGATWESLDPETMLDAVRRLREEHDSLVELVMLTVDFLGDVQDGKHKVNLQALRHLAAEKFRKGLAAREGALTMLCGEVVA